jgi:hypothetical protein
MLHNIHFKLPRTLPKHYQAKITNNGGCARLSFIRAHPFAIPSAQLSIFPYLWGFKR